MHLPSGFIPVQNGDTESRSGTDHDAWLVVDRLAFLKREQIVSPQVSDPMPRGREIVDDAHMRKAEALCNFSLAGTPRQIRERRAAMLDRSRHRETRACDRF